MLIGDGPFTSADRITSGWFLMTGNIWKVLGSVLRYRGQIASSLYSVVFPLWSQQQDYISCEVMYWMCVSVCLCPCVSLDQSGRSSGRKCLRASQVSHVTVWCIIYITDCYSQVQIGLLLAYPQWFSCNLKSMIWFIKSCILPVWEAGFLLQPRQCIC